MSGLSNGHRWPTARLCEVSEINPPRRGLQRSDDQPTTFIPMAAVDGRTGSIVDALERPYGEVKKGYTFFREGDVLFAKITPCMENGKHVIATGLIDGFGFGTTEFHVIRPGPHVSARWIHRYVLQERILSDAANHFTGSVGQQRVPPEYLGNISIPLPPISEQNRILEALNNQLMVVERALDAAEFQRKLVTDLSSKLRENVFSPEIAFSRRPLGDLVSISAKLVNPIMPEYRDLPHINGDNIEGGSGRLLPYRSAREDNMRSGKFLFAPATVLYSKIRPYLRKVTYVDFPGLCSADVYPLTTDPTRMLPKFLLLLLLSNEFTAYADAESRRTRMPKLNRDQLMRWSAPCPSLAAQDRFIKRIGEAEHKISEIDYSLIELHTLIKKLQNGLSRTAFGDAP